MGVGDGAMGVGCICTPHSDDTRHVAGLLIVPLYVILHIVR